MNLVYILIGVAVGWALCALFVMARRADEDFPDQPPTPPPFSDN